MTTEPRYVERELTLDEMFEGFPQLHGARAELDSLRLERDALLAALTRLEAHVRILPPEYDGEGSPLAQARAALTAASETGVGK
jgi:hypothetical protein